jgi:hypothetical protein
MRLHQPWGQVPVRSHSTPPVPSGRQVGTQRRTYSWDFKRLGCVNALGYELQPGTYHLEFFVDNAVRKDGRLQVA